MNVYLKTVTILSTTLIFYGNFSAEVDAYPEFQDYVEKKSGRTVNCAMCHVNNNGPVGNEPGQIGSLSKDDLANLNKARAALTPGQKINNPILNEFGNKLLDDLGKRKILECRSKPEELIKEMNAKSDLDADGITDQIELQDGTDPLNKDHGDPGRMFAINFSKNIWHIVLALLSIFILDFGIMRFLMGFDVIARKKASRL